MLHNKTYTLFLLIIVFCGSLSSCATVLNSSISKVSIQPSETTNYVIDGDTLINRSSEPLTTRFRNSREPLQLNLFNEDHEQTVEVYPIRSKPYYLNFFSPYWAGFLVDELSTRKWKYPRRVYVDMKTGGYLPYFPMDTAAVLSRPNRLAITPMAPVGDQHPGIELAFQRLIDVRYAFQASYKQFIPANSNIARDASGFNLGFELKYYYRNTVNSRFYLSANLEYLNKRHQAVLAFAESDFDYAGDYLVVYNLADIHKKFYSFSPRFGIELTLGKKLVLDSYVGAGLRFRNVSQRNTPPGLEHISSEWEWFDINYDSNKATKSLGANLDLNFRVGWVF